VSLTLFAFEKGGFLKEHRAEGEVIIHAIAGKLAVTVANEELTLGPGELLSLAPGLVHSVRAIDESEMLLTVARASPA
jgi:quercetin dioxygenase-like cupin family protein